MVLVDTMRATTGRRDRDPRVPAARPAGAAVAALPDAVLQPPTPMPWDQPRQPPEQRDPVPPPDPPPDPATTHWPPTQTWPSNQGWAPAPARPRRRRWLPIGIIVATLTICTGAVANGILVAGFSTSIDNGDGMEVLVELPSEPGMLRSPGVSLSAPTSIVEGGPETSFDLPVGTGVRFSDQDGTWTVALLGVDRIDKCDDLLGSTMPAIVFDIQYEVIEGAVSVIPMTDFAFVQADGLSTRGSMLSACVNPPLDPTIIAEGDGRRGWVAIQLPAGADGSSGKLTYGQMVVPTASWSVP